MDHKCPFFRGLIPHTFLAFDILSTGEWRALECGAGLGVMESIEPHDMYHVEELLKVELLVKISGRNNLKVPNYLSGGVVINMV